MNGKLLQKIYFRKNAKKTCKPNKRDLNRDWNDIWIFLIFFVFTIVFPLELETRLYLLVYYYYNWYYDLRRWAVAGHKLWKSITFLIFKTPLAITPIRERNYDVLRTKIDIWLTPNPWDIELEQKLLNIQPKFTSQWWCQSKTFDAQGCCWMWNCSCRFWKSICFWTLILLNFVGKW